MIACCEDCGRVDPGRRRVHCRSCGGRLVFARIAPKRPREGRRKRRQRPSNGMSPQRERIYARDGYRCVECGTSEDLTLDHRIPKSRGGPSTDDNLQTMCAPCNQAKADSMPAGVVGSV